MRRQVQQRGERDWGGEDLLDLQQEPLEAIDAFFAEYEPCVIRGCAITANGSNFDIASGYLSLKGINHDGNSVQMVVPFDGITNTTLPVYFALSYTTVTDTYGDGAVKPIAYEYNAVATTTKPSGECLELSQSAKVYFVDVIQDTDHRFMTDTERNKLSGIATGATNYSHPTSHPASMIEQDGTHRFMTDTERTKLNGIAENANNYSHPDDTDTRHVTDAEKTAWNAKAPATLATTSANGLMSSTDKAKLDGLNSKVVCAGSVAGINIGTSPNQMPITGDNLVNIVGEVSVVQMGNMSSSYGVTYIVTHNTGKSNYPSITPTGLTGGLGYPIAHIITDIDDNKFHVRIGSETTSTVGYLFGAYGNFNFKVEVFE